MRQKVFVYGNEALVFGKVRGKVRGRCAPNYSRVSLRTIFNLSGEVEVFKLHEREILLLDEPPRIAIAFEKGVEIDRACNCKDLERFEKYKGFTNYEKVLELIECCKEDHCGIPSCVYFLLPKLRRRTFKEIDVIRALAKIGKLKSSMDKGKLAFLAQNNFPVKGCGFEVPLELKSIWGMVDCNRIKIEVFEGGIKAKDCVGSLVREAHRRGLRVRIGKEVIIEGGCETSKLLEEWGFSVPNKVFVRVREGLPSITFTGCVNLVKYLEGLKLAWSLDGGKYIILDPSLHKVVELVNAVSLEYEVEHDLEETYSELLWYAKMGDESALARLVDFYPPPLKFKLYEELNKRPWSLIERLEELRPWSVQSAKR